MQEMNDDDFPANQVDLFGSHVEIKDNPLLERICNEILRLVNNKPELLDGDDLSKIDRRLAISLWLDSGLRNIISDVELRGQVTGFLADTKRCTSFDVVSRARRLLVSQDKIRLSQSAIISGHENKKRVEQSLRH